MPGDALGDQQYDHAGADRSDQPAGTAQATTSFPAQLRRLRRERGLSLADLARQTHYSKGYLSKIETGVKRATVDVARQCDHILRADGELLRLVREAGPAERGAGAAADTAAPACPYRGLSAFTSQDAAWFFGRERSTAALVERVFQRVGGGPLLLVAPSGAGKSSLLNAGLVPALRRPGGFPMPGAERWPVVALTPTVHPLDELLERTAKALGSDLHLTAQELTDRPEALLEAVRSRSRVHRPAPTGAARRRSGRCCWSTSSRNSSPSARTRARDGPSSGCCARSPPAAPTPPSSCSAYVPTSPAAASNSRNWHRCSRTDCSSCCPCPWRSCASPSPGPPNSPASPSNPAWSPPPARRRPARRTRHRAAHRHRRHHPLRRPAPRLARPPRHLAAA